MDRFAGTSASDNVARAIQAARAAFGPDWTPSRVAIAPGRIELLGNHVDYNGGPVLAAAIDRIVAVAANDHRDEAFMGVAADVPGQPIELFEFAGLKNWRNRTPPPQPFDYARGLIAGIMERPWLTSRLPATFAIAGDVPVGFGVSSSAALCVSMALALADGFSGPEDVVLLAQEAEHRAGTPCGTMDQSASVAGGVIAFDGATLGVERLSPLLGDLVFVVADSGVDRSLGASSYPTRVAESHDALQRARAALGIDVAHLAALSPEQATHLIARGALPEPLDRRVQHVVEETARVHEGRAAMTGGDWDRFGRLMTASGRSSDRLYDISHPRVEELVATALAVPGVLGARMMGGGEGGSALMLLPSDLLETLRETLLAQYYRLYGMDNRDDLIHACAFAPGAALITDTQSS